MKEVPDYTGHHELVGDADIAKLSSLIEELEDAKMHQEIAAEELKAKTKRVTQLEQYELPELMLALNTRKHETASGLILTLKETIRCSVPKANKDRCMKWLLDNKQGGLIKDTVTVAFNVNQHDEAVALQLTLSEEHGHVMQEQKVEPSTMRAFIKRQLESGVDFPMEMFGAYQQQVAVVKTKRRAESF